MYDEDEIVKENVKRIKRAIVKANIKRIRDIVLILAGGYFASWIVICIFIKIVTMCFSITFKLSVATGIWLIICAIMLLIKQIKEIDK